MPGPYESLEARLLATFKIEAREHVQAMAAAFGALEKAPAASESPGMVEAAFRSAHSLKGAARAVNAKEIETLCHAVESVFTGLKRRGGAPARALFDLLYRVLDALDVLLRRMDPSEAAAEKPGVSELIAELGAASKTAEDQAPWQTSPSLAPVPHAVASSSQDYAERLETAGTVRVATRKLDAMLLQAAELIPARMAASQHAGRLRELGEQFSEWKKSWTRIRPAVRGIGRNLESTGGRHEDRNVSRLLEFVESNQNFVERMDRQLAELGKAAENDQRSLASMVDHLLEETAKVAMQPFSTVLDLFPRFLRDVSRDQNKEIDFVVHGAELEIDRRILQEIKDPLIHLIRNSIGHGIEVPSERAKAGKNQRGTITISVAAKDGASVELLVSDDGAGIDIERLKSVVVEQGLLAAEEAAGLSDADALQLIFRSGATTSPIITDLSGRGLGLAIAREKVTHLNGTISVESQRGRGAIFRIVLPLTLARFRGVVVQARQNFFVLPTAAVDQVIRMREDLVKTVENRETITVSDQAYALARLADLLSLPLPSGSQPPPTHFVAVILSSNGGRIAIGVDSVLAEQEILVKPLGPQLAGFQDFAGATVLASGALAPILSVPELTERASRPGSWARRLVPDRIENEEPKKILVAEDSVTSRVLLKSILETAGYRVETAVDGIDALAKLQTREFDLVVSDVDMPRMNGFGLTAKIRGDRILADLPVVLVTSLDSAKDREHGIDVGASAYIIKSSFDQNNLLQVVRQLL